CQERDGGGDVVGGAQAAEGDLVEHGGALGVGEGLGHVGFDEAGGDDVDGDAAGADFTGEGFAEADDAGLGGDVVGLAGVAHDADHGGDVDDAALALLHHAAQAGFGEPEDRGEVGVDDL